MLANNYKLDETENSLFKFITVMLSFKLSVHYSLLQHKTALYAVQRLMKRLMLKQGFPAFNEHSSKTYKFF